MNKDLILQLLQNHAVNEENQAGVRGDVIWDGDFEEVANEIKALQEIESDKEWISVKKQLPKECDEMYIICVKNKNKDDGIYIVDCAYWTSDLEWKRFSTWEDVLFFRKLPNKPKIYL